ncbi:TIGR01841 family phasin [Zoogloea sp.]|jgi:phasin family protein|uniref:TIGR01841 family phasin n=1 Tax=Zoogloea sp. TaxID=49181 RepID=UPI002B8EAE8E|nr:TIGR01841 family phasin [Zoogloea sp.]HQA10045.1 TIGR01841 family phasin [Zoogloea sp.]
MSVTPEVIAAAAKSNVEAGLNSASSFVATVFAAVERVSTLNLATARTAFDESVAFSKAVMATKDPKALAALNLGVLTPSVEKGVAYGRSLSAIGTDTKEELTKLIEAEAAAAGKNFDAALESLFKNAPAGSEAAVKAVKTALANASTAYEGAAKAAKQVVAAAQASVEKAAEVAVQNVEKGSKAAASALKVA